MAIPFSIRIPFLELIGCQLERFEHNLAEISIELRDDTHMNSFGVAHGGLTMTMLDVAMAHAARGRFKDLPDGGPGLVTLEMKTSFMRPGLGRLRAVGTVLHGTAQLAFTEGRMLNEQGEVVAHATATFKYLRALPIGGGAARPMAQPLGAPGSGTAPTTPSASGSD